MIKIFTLLLSLITSYPLPAWKILSLAVHRLPGSSHLQILYIRSDGATCTFTFKGAKSSFKCTGEPMKTVSFPGSITIYRDTCESALISFLSVLAGVKDEESFEKVLIQAGVDTSQIGVRRWEGDVAVVLGESLPDAPEIWFHQETHLPVYMKLFDERGEKMEITVSDYLPVKGLRAFPARVQFICAEKRMVFMMNYVNP